MGKYQVEVYNCNALNVRTGASTSYRIVTTIRRGQKFTSSKQHSSGWMYIDEKKGWASNKYLKKIKDLTPKPKPKPATSKPPNTKPPIEDTPSYGSDLMLDGATVKKILKAHEQSSRKLKASMRMFGTPFQFLPSVDQRLDEEQLLGRKYTETILAEACVVSIAPGRPIYLPDLNKAQQDGFGQYYRGLTSNNNDANDLLNVILGSKETRYFDFAADYASYIKYVNLLCRTVAVYMGLGDKTVEWDKTSKMDPLKFENRYKGYNWGWYRYEDVNQAEKDKHKEKHKVGIFGGSSLKDYIESSKDTWEDITKTMTQSIFEALFGNFQYVNFYVDPNSSFTETSSNSTQKSFIEGMLDKAQDASKELSFFLGAADAQTISAGQAELGSSLSTLGGKIDDNGGAGFISRLFGTAGTVVAGANMIFPEIWMDSDYNKSYTVSVNLFSPYGDKESIYLNIMVPLMHLLALASPRQTSPNSFASPFLVRVASKGWFSCDMGMVDNISIEKVAGSWTVDGLPSEVRVQLSIKDLYPSLMMTPTNRPFLFFNNNALVQYLAVTAGVDVTSTHIMLKLKTIGYTLFNRVMDLDNEIYQRAMTNINNFVRGGFLRFFNV